LLRVGRAIARAVPPARPRGRGTPREYPDACWVNAHRRRPILGQATQRARGGPPQAGADR